VKEDLAIQLRVLRKAEAAENYLLYKQFYTHGIGGYEECETPDWSNDDAYNIALLIEKGFLAESKTKGDEPWLGGPEPEAVHTEIYVRLTPNGHEFVRESSGFGRLRKWIGLTFRGLAMTSGQIFVSVVTAAATVFVLKYLGLGD
jgi:hypothetical protein